MAQKLKITGGSPSQTVSHAAVGSVPSGATVLCSAGSFPTATTDQIVPTVPVHVDSSDRVTFLVNGRWLRPDGTVAG